MAGQGELEREVERLKAAIRRERRRNRLFREAVRRAAHDAARGESVRAAIEGALGEIEGEGGMEHRAEVERLLAPVWNFSWVAQGELAGCGRPDTRRAVETLAAEGVAALLSLDAPPPVEWLSAVGMVGRYVEGVPDMSVPGPAQLREAVGWVEEQRGQGRVVAVHCEAGIERTAVVLAACLVARGMDAEAAIEQVGETRPLPLTSPAGLAAVRRLAAERGETDPSRGSG